MNYIKEKTGYAEPEKNSAPPIKVKNYTPKPDLDLSAITYNPKIQTGKPLYHVNRTVNRNKPPATRKPKIYSWTDEKGIKHYTNIPPENLNIVERAWEAEVSRPEPVRKYARQNPEYRTSRTPAPDGSASYTPASYTKRPEKKTGFRELSPGIYECNGYTFNISANRVGDMLNVRGRVSDGEYCEKLEAEIICTDRNGRRKSVRANLTNIGGNRSDLIREDKKVYRRYKTPSEKWDITNIDVTCTEN
ncbi:MAG: hypothetical protein AB7S75_07775 [Desulfococcaceae bacterium]